MIKEEKEKRIKWRPQLSFNEKPIRSLIMDELLDDRTLLIADWHNYPKVKDLGANAALVPDSSERQVDELTRCGDYSRIIAIGGCTALDIGRACAGDKEFFAIPTILSTSCLSTDKSILTDEHGKRKAVRSVWPDRTIIPLRELEETDARETARWSSSGLADYIANITSGHDERFRRAGQKGLKEGMHEGWETWRIEIYTKLNWASGNFHGYDMGLLRMLANWLHEASIGNSHGITIWDRKAGGEHGLYYAIMESEGGSEIRATHGQMVSIGTLITAKILEERKIPGFRDYEKMSSAFRLLGLPTDYRDLEALGICKERIIGGINMMDRCDTIIEHHFSENDYTILDRIFGQR